MIFTKNTYTQNIFSNKWLTIFYIIYIFFSGLALSYIPDALSYKYASEISIIIILLPTLFHLKKNLGSKKTFFIVLILGILSLGIEYIALATGEPYGNFYYNNHLSGKISGVLPWTTGLSYLPFLFGAVGLSYYFTKNTLYRVIVSALILVIFDLVLDPGAVAVGMWGYVNPGIYYNVPFSNFVGWAISGTVMSFIAIKLLNKFPKDNLLNLTYSLSISMLLWAWIDLLKNLWIPVIIGIFVIIYLSVIYSKNEKNNSTL
jgi:putative membrane protein